MTDYKYICPMCDVEALKQKHGLNIYGEKICLVCGSLFEKIAIDEKKNTAKKIKSIRSSVRLAKFVGGDFMNTIIQTKSRRKLTFMWTAVWLLLIVITALILTIFQFIIFR